MKNTKSSDIMTTRPAPEVLFTLPIELRLRIYRYVLDDADQLAYHPPGLNDPREHGLNGPIAHRRDIHASLMCTNRAMREEASELFCHHSRWSINPHWAGRGANNVEASLTFEGGPEATTPFSMLKRSFCQLGLASVPKLDVIWGAPPSPGRAGMVVPSIIDYETDPVKVWAARVAECLTRFRAAVFQTLFTFKGIKNLRILGSMSLDVPGVGQDLFIAFIACVSTLIS